MPADRGIAHGGDHVVAMAAEHEGGDVFDRDVEFLREEMTESRGVEHARHADDAVGRKTGGLLQRPHHRVERIGDADDEGVGRMRLDAGADRVHHLQVDAEQVVAAHAGLARHAGGDDDHVGAGDVGVGTRPRQLRVEALDRPGFGEVERLALRNAVDDVEQHDVAEFLHARPDAPASRRSGPPRSGQSSFAPWASSLVLAALRAARYGRCYRPIGLLVQAELLAKRGIRSGNMRMRPRTA